jgi:hypothetical protein
VADKDESKSEKIDRELIELLNELRVALPGVQVLFAFLLAVPFAQGFANVTSFQRALFFAVLLSTAISSIFLIAPSAYHRLHFRQHNKEELLISSNRFAIVGICFLGLAMTGAIILITDFLYSSTATIIAGSIAALFFSWFWIVLPLLRRQQLS